MAQPLTLSPLARGTWQCLPASYSSLVVAPWSWSIFAVLGSLAFRGLSWAWCLPPPGAEAAMGVGGAEGF